MDFLPIKPTSTNKVDASINLANDGGSKSNTGYFSQRGTEEKTPESFDAVTFSNSSSSNLNNELDEVKLDFWDTIKKYWTKIIDFIMKLLGFKKKKIYNIYEKDTL